MVTNIPLQLLPIENDGFHLMVEVEINGKKANLVVDTGASRTVFDEIEIQNYLNEDEGEFHENERLS